jgi:hypothetical protein
MDLFWRRASRNGVSHIQSPSFTLAGSESSRVERLREALRPDIQKPFLCLILPTRLERQKAETNLRYSMDEAPKASRISFAEARLAQFRSIHLRVNSKPRGKSVPRPRQFRRLSAAAPAPRRIRFAYPTTPRAIDRFVPAAESVC